VLVLGVVLLISLVGVVSAFSVDSYHFTSDFNCADFGIECGIPRIIYPNGTIFDKPCGICDTSKYCYNGKCINPSVLGTCERLAGFDTDCSSVLPFSDFYGYPGEPLQSRLENYERVCNLYGCNYNSQTKKCTGTLPSCSYYMNEYCSGFDTETKKGELNEETGICTSTVSHYGSGKAQCVNELKGVWNETDASCTLSDTTVRRDYGSLKPNCKLKEGVWNETDASCTFSEKFLACSAGNLNSDKVGCKLSNAEQYTPKFVVYKSFSLPIERDDGANLIYLHNTDLTDIEEGGSIPISIKGMNFDLPEGTSVSFTVYRSNPSLLTSDLMNQKISATGVIDGQGEVNAEWLLTNEEFLFNDYGYSIFSIAVFVKDVYTGGVSNGVIVFKAKTGECSGIASLCSNYSEETCLGIERFKLGSCTWNYGTNSCNGGQGMSCETFDIKESCLAIGCSWRADSIFERFIDWIKGIFGA